MELKITQEKILQAASKCSTAKQTLEILFPEAFENDLFMERNDAGDGHGNNNSVLAAFKTDGWAVAFEGAKLSGKRIQLSNKFYWNIIKDGSFQYVVPSKTQ